MVLGEFIASKKLKGTPKASTIMVTGSGRIMHCLGGEARGDWRYLTVWYDVHETVGTETLARGINMKVLGKSHRNKTRGTGERC